MCVVGERGLVRFLTCWSTYTFIGVVVEGLKGNV